MTVDSRQSQHSPVLQNKKFQNLSDFLSTTKKIEIKHVVGQTEMQRTDIFMMLPILLILSILPNLKSEMSTEMVKIFDFNSGVEQPEDWWEVSDTVR